MNRLQTIQTEKNASISSKALALFMSFALVSTLMVPSFAYAEENAGEGADSASSSQGASSQDATPGAKSDSTHESLDEKESLEEVGTKDEATVFGLQASADEESVASQQVQAVDADGTDTSWYQDGQSNFSIATAEQLKGFAKLVNAGNSFAGKTVSLAAAIDLGGSEWTPIGTGSRASAAFAAGSKTFNGSFNGNGYTISNFKITSTASGNIVGFFGCLDGAAVSNIAFSNAQIQVSGEAAGIAAGMMINGSSVSGITTDASSSVNAGGGTGGIVGRMIACGNITNCTNNAAVRGSSSNVGGIVGAAYYTKSGVSMTISGCTNTASINGTVVGGIAGLSTANISNCVNSGNVTAPAADLGAGGIVGEQQIYGTVQSNTNSGTITGNLAGGTIGWLRYASYSAANYGLTGVIQVLGNINYGSIVGVSGSLNANGGIIGLAYDQAVVTGNENYAEAISGYNFVSGIVGGMQTSNAPLPGFDRGITVTNNISTTPLDKLQGKCVDLYAYNNDKTYFSASNNTNGLWVAQVNGAKFSTIQEAIDSVTSAAAPAQVTDYVIEVKAGTYDGNLKIIQQENKSIVLKPAEGAAVTINGQIIVDGGGGGQVAANIQNPVLLDRPESVTISGFTFNSSADACVFLTSATANNVNAMYYYSHNVTVENCAFGGKAGMVGVKVGAGGQVFNPAVSNVVVSNCTAANDMHSLLQTSSPVRNLTVSHCSTFGPKGINALVMGSFIVSDCNFNVNSGYAVRMGAGKDGDPLLTCNTQITNCQFNVAASSGTDEGIIVTRTYASSSISITGSSLTGASGVALWNNTNVSQEKAYKINMTGNYWGPQGFDLNRTFGIKGNDSLYSGNYIAHVAFDANGGSFVDAATVQSNATVTFAADGSTKTVVSLPTAPTNGDKVLLGWFTDPLNGNQVFAGSNTGIPADATLYAQWGTVEQQMTVVEDKLGAINEESSSEEIEAAISALTSASQETVAAMVNSDDGEKVIQKIAQLEELYLQANEGKIEATQPVISEEIKSVVTEAKIDGAALSVLEYAASAPNAVLHAEIDIVPVATPELPAGINANVTPISLDITLNVLDTDNVPVASEIQPKAPLTLTIKVDDPDSKFDLDKLIVVHYHAGDDPQIITPKAVRVGSTIEITFTLTKLSSVVIAQRETGLNNGGNDNGGAVENGESTGGNSNNVGTSGTVANGGSSSNSGSGSGSGFAARAGAVGSSESGSADASDASANVTTDKNATAKAQNETKQGTGSSSSGSGPSANTSAQGSSSAPDSAGSVLPIILIVVAAAVVAVAAVLVGRKLLAKPNVIK